MPKITSFNLHWRQYDAWYDKQETINASELKALRRLRPSGRGLEVGVGTGRFAGHSSRPSAPPRSEDPVLSWGEDGFVAFTATQNTYSERIFFVFRTTF
jgi:hypothetical protein